jgi:AcrR family transcriptional regulator
MAAHIATRQTAEERREAVLDAATGEFALKGYHAASTDEIARAAGISQPYLFRLFGSKKDLYVAAAQRSIDELYRVFAAAADGKTGKEALEAMGAAYAEIMQDRTRLMLMLKCWTTTDEPEIRRISRGAWRELVDLVERTSGEPPEVVTRFFAHGMLLTVLMALDLVDDPEPWSRRLLEASWKAIEECG